MKLRFLLLSILLFTVAQYSFATNTPMFKESTVALNTTTLPLSSNATSQIKKARSMDDQWVEEMSNRLSKWMPDEILRKRLLQIVKHEATISNLDPQLVLSVITVESRFNKYAVSSVGAIGLMQIMPFWLKQKKPPSNDLFDINTNIHLGCSILREYLDRENGNLYYALGRYNGSRGQEKYPSLVLNNYSKYWKIT